MPRRAALIGFGAIARAVVERLPEGWAVAGALVRTSRQPQVPAGIAAVTTLEELLALEPEVVLECAGQEAVGEYGEGVLAAGVDLVVIATGALADDELRARLAAAAELGQARAIVPAGAIAGLDGLGALRLGGLSHVAYTSIKPPQAWRGTPAEQVADLDALRARTTVFSGGAREAARQFPKNANLAVTVALAAGALDETAVTLVADPAIQENIGIVEAEGPLGTLKLELRGPAAPDNPRTSAVTALSLVHELERRSSLIAL